MLQVLFPRRRREGLWIDDSAALRKATHGSLEVHLQNLSSRGWTRLERNVDPSLCDQVLEHFYDHCEKHSEEAPLFHDSNGLHSRLTNFHMSSTAALAIGLNERVLALVDTVFAAKAAICSSLIFEKGSQQAIHRDAPFFLTNPPGSWIDHGQTRYAPNY